MKKNKAILFTLIAALLSGTPAFGADYNFQTTYKDSQFGKATGSDKMPDYSHIENIRRDKNAAYFSPKYGVFSGELPTEQTNPYFDLDNNKSEISVLADAGSYDNGVYSTDINSQGLLASTSILKGGTKSETKTSSVADYESAPEVSISYSEKPYTEVHTPITKVNKNSDGSIGTLTIPKLGLNKKVNEGVSIEVMKTAIGHFDFSSQWDGNVSLASHNRGSSAFFSGIWNLTNGDEVTYTTSAGTRSYFLYNKIKIDENDFSYLTATDENTLSLVTCVENQPNLRWLIQCREKK